MPSSITLHEKPFAVIYLHFLQPFYKKMCTDEILQLISCITFHLANDVSLEGPGSSVTDQRHGRVSASRAFDHTVGSGIELQGVAWLIADLRTLTSIVE